MYRIYGKSRINPFFGAILGLLLFLPGCRKPFSSPQQKPLPVSTDVRTQLHDVTLPIDCQVAPDSQSQRVTALSGALRQRLITRATRDQLVQLYTGEMPYNGWRLFGQFGDHARTVLTYEKMHKQLVIIIEPGLYETQLDIMLVHKTDELI